MEMERTLEIDDESLNSALSFIHGTSFRGFSIERYQTLVRALLLSSLSYADRRSVSARENMMPCLASGFARSARGRSIDPLACYHPRVCVSRLSKGDHISTRFGYFPWKSPNNFAVKVAVCLNNGNAGIAGYTYTYTEYLKET